MADPSSGNDYKGLWKVGSRWVAYLQGDLGWKRKCPEDFKPCGVIFTVANMETEAKRRRLHLGTQ